MLKINSHRGNVDLMLKGSILDVAADLLTAINSMYRRLLDDGNVDEAEFLRDFLTLCVNDGSLFTEDSEPEDEDEDEDEEEK